MTDDRDRFDRDLAARLGTSEARVPSDGPPDPEGTGRPRYALATAAGATLVAVAGVIIVMNLARPVAVEPSPTATGSPSTGPSLTSAPTPTSAATTTPLVTPTQPPPPPTTDLGWTVTGHFAEEGDVTQVRNVVEVNGQLVATGIRYVGGLPAFGPTPERLPLVWTSIDGRRWDSVVLGDAFHNDDLGEIVVRPDGSLLALGYRATAIDEHGRIDTEEAAAWESDDGRSWTAAQSGPTDSYSWIHVVQGARGYLAVVRPSGEPPSYEASVQLWYSADARSWDLVRTYDPPVDPVSVDAGDEGFVMVSRIGQGEHMVEASGDGQAWFQSTSVPPGAYLDVVAAGPDWVLVTDDNDDVRRGTTWFSANGLGWSQLGRVVLAQRNNDPDVPCREWVSGELSAAPWLIVSTNLQYPCSEGGFVAHGTQYISVDGASWVAIPLDSCTVPGNRCGSSVASAVAANGALVLAGDQDGAATFWIGEP